MYIYTYIDTYIYIYIINMATAVKQILCKGQTGVYPTIGLGTSYLVGTTQITSTIKNAISMGYRRIDTSPTFSPTGNEKEIGIGIRESGVERSQLYITSHVPADSMRNSFFVYDQAMKSMEKLGVEYLDCLNIQWPGYTWAGVNRSPLHFKFRYLTWKALEKLQSENKVKNIGLSNFSVNHIKEIFEYSQIRPAVNQIEFHALNHRQQDELIQFCQEHKIIIDAYGILGRGNSKLLSNTTVQEIAKKHNKTSAQVLIKFIQSCYEGQLAYTIKATSNVHLQDNLNVNDFELTRNDIQALKNLSHINYRFHPDPRSVGTA